MDESIREALRLIPNKRSVKDRQRKCIFTPLERDSHFTVASRLPPFDRITLKIALVLHIQVSSMKLMVVSFLYMRVFHFFIKKRKRALRPDSFFSMILTFLKYFNSNHILPSYSLFLKCFSWFFYLGVHRGTGVFS